MPLYEYRCEPCDHPFEALIRNGSDVVHCPKCGGVDVAKQFSVPAATPSGTLGYAPASVPAGCGKLGCGPGGCAMN